MSKHAFSRASTGLQILTSWKILPDPDFSTHYFCRGLFISAEISRKPNLRKVPYFQKNF